MPLYSNLVYGSKIIASAPFVLWQKLTLFKTPPSLQVHPVLILYDWCTILHLQLCSPCFYTGVKPTQIRQAHASIFLIVPFHAVPITWGLREKKPSGRHRVTAGLPPSAHSTTSTTSQVFLNNRNKIRPKGSTLAGAR